MTDKKNEEYAKISRRVQLKTYQFMYYSGSSKRNNSGNVFTALYEFPSGKVSTTRTVNRWTLMTLRPLLNLTTHARQIPLNQRKAT
ncbi:hypothetical protein BMR06_16750 [Methylococcaceae bacterium HT5]|nr:hypothetical protein BMR06_16750 [Methylococcaceae bacterium HT5]